MEPILRHIPCNMSSLKCLFVNVNNEDDDGDLIIMKIHGITSCFLRAELCFLSLFSSVT
jgi:hypothetical protein